MEKAIIGHRKRPNCAARLMVRALEQRCVPATFVVTNNGDSGIGSLRSAIESANISFGADSIAFNMVGSKTIALATSLPSIVDTVAIDATTQPGYNQKPLVVIDGANGIANGLLFVDANNGSAVKGLSIVNFSFAGIRTADDSFALTIQSNYIGVLPDGVTAAANKHGVFLGSSNYNASGCLIGGSDKSKGNVISGNEVGVLIYASSNRIYGNLIGTDLTGSVAIPNQIGVELIISGYGNQIGGVAAAEGNLISGNTKYGISLADAAGNQILGNKIGTDISGTSALGNGIGIQLGSDEEYYPRKSWENSIGGIDPGAGNVIAYNVGPGIAVQSMSASNAVLGNSIHHNGGIGIDVYNVGPNGPDSSASNLLTAAQMDPRGIAVAGQVSRWGNHRLQFFASSAPHSSGYGEGTTFLGDVFVSGQTTYAAIIKAAPAGSYISMTDSNYLGTGFVEFPGWYHLSEFSKSLALPSAVQSGGTIVGRAFQDANANNRFDAGELSIPGMAVYLDSNNNGIADLGDVTQVTAADGMYGFVVAGGGPVAVRIATPTSLVLSGLDAAVLQIGGGLQQAVDFGFRTPTLATGVVTGRVFADLNNNGLQEINEPGLPGVQVGGYNSSLNQLNTGTRHTLTTFDGSYSLRIEAGKLSVTAGLPADFAYGSGTSGEIVVTAGGTTSNIFHGRRPIVSVKLLSGQTFFDANGNGVRNAGEQPLNGFNVFLDQNGDGIQNPGETATTSNSDGSFLLTVPSSASGTLRVFGSTNYVATTGSITVPVGTVSQSGLAIGFQLQKFGGTITGRTFIDSNKSGSIDIGEPGHASNIVYLDANDNGALDIGEDKVLTKGDGSFAIPVASDGSFVVRVISPSGFTASGATAAKVAVAGGANVNVGPFGSVSDIVKPQPLLATGAGAGGGPHVTVRNADGSVRFGLFAYDPNFTGGVRVATGDVNGDGVEDFVTAPGPGGGPHVKVFDGTNGKLLREFFAYAASFAGGVTVAVGDVNDDGKADIVTGAGRGGGPHVRVFSGADGKVLREFFAYSGSFDGGVNVAADDVTGDQRADIITGPGAGGGPHVKVFDAVTGNVVRETFAYAASFIGGVNVAAGDLDGDGQADIITAPASAGGPHIRAFSGANLSLLRSYFAFDAAFTGGINVAIKDMNGDGMADIITGSGPSSNGSQAARWRWWDGRTNEKYFDQVAYPGFLGGMFVG